MRQLICQSIKKSYKKKVVLECFDLRLSQGEAVGLLGVNGAGKSTSIKTLLGLVQPDSGETFLDSASIGYLPEVALMPESISPLCFVSLAANLRGSAIDMAEKALNEMSLDHTQIHQPIRHLSKGLRQRVALAYALCSSPQWIILDEPMSGLDAIGRVAVLDVLTARKVAGAGILICSHIVPDLVRLADRVMLMNHGKICEEVSLQNHDMDEVHLLENRLQYWGHQ